MQDPFPPSASCMSPKRKRDDDEVLVSGAPSPSRLKTTALPTAPQMESDLVIAGSPRSTVAGRLQNLDLDEHHQIPSLDIDLSFETQQVSTDRNSGGFHPQIFLPPQSFVGPITPPTSSSGPPSGTSQLAYEVQPTTMPIEIPETPRLRPVSSPTPPPSTPKPKSPPPPSPALWWSDTEITGYNPSDPTDDGYGINGVGFLPTPAIANARAERRKKQVAEWKNREAREARQKRSDRRRRRDRSVGGSTDHGNGSSRAEEGRRVRFLEV